MYPVFTQKGVATQNTWSCRLVALVNKTRVHIHWRPVLARHFGILAYYQQRGISLTEEPWRVWHGLEPTHTWQKLKKPVRCGFVDTTVHCYIASCGLWRQTFGLSKELINGSRWVIDYVWTWALIIFTYMWSPCHCVSVYVCFRSSLWSKPWWMHWC